jgi:hypothetical protein
MYDLRKHRLNDMESAMTPKPTLQHSRAITCFIAAAFAGTITTGIFAGVTALFQRDGNPFEQQLSAERACAVHVYVSEREACVRQRLTARRQVARSISNDVGE